MLWVTLKGGYIATSRVMRKFGGFCSKRILRSCYEKKERATCSGLGKCIRGERGDSSLWEKLREQRFRPRAEGEKASL